MTERKTIVLIDDSPTIQAGVRAILSESGYQVFCASDGIQGLSVARDKQPDLIILDIQMPAGGGATLYERLQAMDSTRHIPVVVFTAMSSIEIEQRTTLPPGTATLFKADGFQRLAEFVKAQLG